MNNEIKQGDKVRVSKDAPKMYVSGHCRFFYGVEGVVKDVEDGNAIIMRDDGSVNKALAIPTKYLVKVDAEAKEAKFKVNDIVRTVFNEITHITSVLENGNYYLYGMGNEYPEDSLTLIRPYIEPTAPKFKVGDRVKFKNIYELQKVKDESFRWMLVMFASKEATITAVEDNGFYRVDIDPSIGGINDDMIECKIEPTEQTEAEKTDSDNLKEVAEEWANTVSNAIKEYGDVLCQTYIDAHNEAYWDAYAADLAKEVALKVANKFNDPEQAAAYAVSVAKAVVEGLKRK